MDHDQWTEAISARLDGEDAGPSTDDITRHLAGCPSCRRFRAETVAMNRSLRLHPAPPVPDRTAELVAVMGQTSLGGRRLEWARALLVGLAALQVTAALSAVAGLGPSVPIHLSREVAALNLALAVGLGLAAMRPVLALGLLPLFAVFAVGTLVAAAADISSGRVTVFDEARHLLEVGAVAALWWLLRPRRALWRAWA